MNADDFANALDPFTQRVRGMVRRVVVKLTTKVAWQLLGFDSPAGKNTFNSELFPGIGYYSRPPANGTKVEAIVLSVGSEASTPAIVATRDEATRAAVAGDLKDDETAVFNSRAIVRINQDGTIEARSAGGTAVSLATKADLQALVNYITSTMVITCPAGTSTPGATPAPPNPTGTTKLKGE